MAGEYLCDHCGTYHDQPTCPLKKGTDQQPGATGLFVSTPNDIWELNCIRLVQMDEEGWSYFAIRQPLAARLDFRHEPLTYIFRGGEPVFAIWRVRPEDVNTRIKEVHADIIATPGFAR